MTANSPANQSVGSIIESMEGVHHVQKVKSFIYIPRGHPLILLSIQPFTQPANTRRSCRAPTWRYCVAGAALRQWHNQPCSICQLI